MSRNRSEPMPVKYWSRAGLMLSWWCNARCPSCYLACSPAHKGWVDPDWLLRVWAGLVAASPHGCRVHLTGGEPFGNFPLLLEICRRARTAGLGPLEKIETNAFWASDDGRTAEWIGLLDRAGMEKLAISADPWHQRFVPIARARSAARIARDILGPDRVQVRWEDWLAEGTDTAGLAGTALEQLARRLGSQGRDRYNGRAAEELAGGVDLKPLSTLADRACNHALLRGKHVHISPEGLVIPGTCAGIVLGRIGPDANVGAIRQGLHDERFPATLAGILAEKGPAGLAEHARPAGFIPRAGYASKCHLCWHVRSWLHRQGGPGCQQLGPDWWYRPQRAGSGRDQAAGQA